MKSVVRFIVGSIIAVFLGLIFLCALLAHCVLVVFEWFARLAQKVENLLMKLANKYCDYWGPIFRGGKK